MVSIPVSFAIHWETKSVVTVTKAMTHLVRTGEHSRMVSIPVSFAIHWESESVVTVT